PALHGVLDFRPDYLRLGAIIEALGHPIVLALTATAAPPVRSEILERLGMRDAKVVVRDFDRPAIHLTVEPCPDQRTKQRVLLERIEELDRPGIVYVATRRHAEEISRLLRDHGPRADHFHAGLGAAERRRAQQAFMDG